MKESISMAALFNIIIVFVSVLIIVFIGSTSYSKAYKVKNKIVEEIEKNEGYNREAAIGIENWLNGSAVGSNDAGGIGYRQLTAGMNESCARYGDGMTPVSRITVNNNYHYCIYRTDTCGSRYTNTKVGNKSCGTYYRVVTFMYLDLPIIGDLIEVPVAGETTTFRDIHKFKDGD